MIVIRPTGYVDRKDDGNLAYQKLSDNGLHWINQPTNDANRQRAIAQLFEEAKSFVVGSRTRYARSLNDMYTLAQSYVQSGSVAEEPEPVTVNEKFKVPRNNGKAWREAKANPALIVVSDYDVGEVKLTYNSIPTERDIGYYGYNDIPIGLFRAGAVNGWLYLDSRTRVNAQRGIFRVYFHRYSVTWGPIERMSPVDLIEMCEHKIDPGLVASTVAKADKACLDVLTSVAEMPDTVRSIIAGFRVITNMVRDVKKRNITISASFDKRKQYLKAKFERDMDRLERKLSTIKSSKKKASLQQSATLRQIADRRKAYSIARENLAKELADALSDVWMNFRYNIMPNVLMVEDFINLIESYHADFKTSRDGFIEEIPVELPGWNSFAMRVKQGCVIKRRIDPDIRFTSLTHANLVTTAWELVPLSFVVDWFINIGDVLTSTLSPNLALNEGATYTVKYSVQQSVVSQSGLTNCRIDLNITRRRVIQPTQEYGLSFNADLSFYRKLDALALLWRPIKTMLNNLKR